MECHQCGARRPRTGPCPNCGAPPPGTFSSLRQWKDTTRSGQGPAVGGGGGGRRSGSGADWGGGGGGAGQSGASNRGRGGARRGGSGADWGGAAPGWDDGEAAGWDDDRGYDPEPPAGRSNPRNRRYPDPGYQEVDLSRALVPARDEMPLMDPSANAGLPAMLGIPATDEQERALGIRRPVYIPAAGGKRKRKLGTWRVLSGVSSVILVCVASCALAALLGPKLPFPPKPGNTIIGQAPPISATGVPVTPVATLGAQGPHFQGVTTATGVDTSGNAITPTSHFLVNSSAYVVATVRNITKGEKHTVSIRWYLRGQNITAPPTYLDLGDVSRTSRAIDSDKQVYFALTIPQPGVYIAKLYLDLPAKGDNPDAPGDKYLGATITFLVETPTPVPTPTKPKPPATATPVRTPSGTPSAAPSPSPSAQTGAAPVAWRQGVYGYGA
jgi:hypothetical protein